MQTRDVSPRIGVTLGALLGYGALAAFVYLISLQIYRWFREGDWTHIGTSDGLQIALAHCCARDGDTGWLARLYHWLDAPVDWLGLHKLLELLPASLSLLLLSILGNAIFVHCRDLIDAETAAGRLAKDMPHDPAALGTTRDLDNRRA